MGKLTDRTVRSLGKGKYGDGDGLMLVVSENQSRKWVLRYQLNGRRRDMGLGSYPEVELKTARTLAAQARAGAALGVDPLTARKQAREAAQPVPTFGMIATDVIAQAKARTDNKKVQYQWERHLGPAYCSALIDKPINTITTIDVAAVLRPIWRTKPEVARKLYPAIRRVFEQGRILLRDKHGINIGNPALWDDLKAMGFEAPQQLTRGRHPSLPYHQMPQFISALREREAISARLLEFVILTNVRTGAAIAARWSEFDLEAGIWSVPVVNLKDKKSRKEAFRIPLSDRAKQILNDLSKSTEVVFPSSGGEHLSNMSMLNLLRRMGVWNDPTTGKPITVHGFRASFKTWAKETRQDRDLVEEAMGHVIGSSVERAYDRSDVLEHRRELMKAWASHCQPGPCNVIRLAR